MAFKGITSSFCGVADIMKFLYDFHYGVVPPFHLCGPLCVGGLWFVVAFLGARGFTLAWTLSHPLFIPA
jgi:hypothetical protein